MNVVDSSAWIAYFTGGAHADIFEGPIVDAHHLIVPSICILEVFKYVARHRGEDEALQCAAVMHQGLVVDLDAALAMDAARMGLDHKLPMADSVVFATAKMHRAIIWTQDADFKGLPGVKYFESKK